MVNIKLCGLKEPSHIKTAWELGVKYIGVVFFQDSPRSLTIEHARPLLRYAPEGLVKVGLVVNPNDELIRSVCSLNVNMIQLHGSETIERVKQIKDASGLPVIKAVGLGVREDLTKVNHFAKVADQILIDAKPNANSNLPGGNGLSFDWELIKNNCWKFPWFLAGGLHENNVVEALKKTDARQIDLSSGVEDKDGRKDLNKIVKFVQKVKEYEEFHSATKQN